jgi:hypothetical protein
LELIGIAGTAVFLLLVRLPSTSEIRPFNHVPPEASWWEYMVFGATMAIFAPLTFISIASVVIVLPVLIPFKMLRVYVLGPSATLTSALVALPLVFLTISICFSALYIWLLVKEKGNLVRNQVPLYAAKPFEPLPFAETYYFSLSTMVKGTPQYEATGWCRWVALLEITVSRLLEVAVVTIGIGTILKRGHL